MEELTIEQKAKAYDEAKARMRRAWNDNRCTLGFMNEIFPELKESKESEDERIRKALINGFNKLDKSAVWYNGITNGQILAWLEKQGNNMGISEATKRKLEDSLNKALEKETSESCNEFLDEQGEQKPAWSEEDEYCRNQLIVFCENCMQQDSSAIKCANWLKSLKDMVQPKQEWKQENTGDLTDFENAMMHIGDSFFGQHAGLDPNDTSVVKEQAKLLLELVPKQEWSEEDERKIELLKSLIEDAKGDSTSYSTMFREMEELNNWLKSLKDRFTWKPSDEQLKTFDYYMDADISNKDKEVLLGLYNDLKQL